MPEAAPETVHILGEGGTRFELALPLHEAIADRIASGHIRRVNPDGTPYTGPADESVPGLPTEAPKPSATKTAWAAWAVACGAEPDDAQAMTRQDLIDGYAGATPAETPPE